MSVISTATNTVTATVTVGTGPYGVAITPNGLYAYVANYNAGTVSVISTATNLVTATVTGGHPSQRGGDHPQRVVRLRGQPGRVNCERDQHRHQHRHRHRHRRHRPVRGGDHPNGAVRLRSNSGSGTVSVISTATNAVTATVAVVNGP